MKAQGNGAGAVKYEGDLKDPAALAAFLDLHRAATKKGGKKAAASKPEAKEGNKGAGKEEEGGKGGKGGGPNGKPPAFQVLDAGSFKGEVYKDAENAWLVWFKPSAGACVG